MLVSPGVAKKAAPVYDDRMDDWEDINAKDALVSLTTVRWQID